MSMATQDLKDTSGSVSWENDTVEEPICNGAATGDPASIIAFGAMAVTTILVIVLNPLCLVALRRASGIQDTTKIFMASLTICDLCTGIFWGIAVLIEYASLPSPPVKSFLCMIFTYMSPIFMTASILSLLVMTIDRYIAIAHPLQYPSLVTPQRSKVIVGLLWAAVVIQHAVIAVTSQDRSLCDIWCDTCVYMYIGTIGASLGIILLLYAHILKIAQRQAGRIAAQNYAANGQEGQNAPRPVSTRSATTVFIIAGSAFLCWIPQIVYSTVVQTLDQYSCAIIYITDILSLTNGWLNVVIYYWRNRELREAMRTCVTSCYRQL